MYRPLMCHNGWWTYIMHSAGNITVCCLHCARYLPGGHRHWYIETILTYLYFSTARSEPVALFDQYYRLRWLVQHGYWLQSIPGFASVGTCHSLGTVTFLRPSAGRNDLTMRGFLLSRSKPWLTPFVELLPEVQAESIRSLLRFLSLQLLYLSPRHHHPLTKSVLRVNKAAFVYQ